MAGAEAPSALAWAQLGVLFVEAPLNLPETYQDSHFLQVICYSRGKASP